MCNLIVITMLQFNWSRCQGNGRRSSNHLRIVHLFSSFILYRKETCPHQQTLWPMSGSFHVHIAHITMRPPTMTPHHVHTHRVCRAVGASTMKIVCHLCRTASSDKSPMKIVCDSSKLQLQTAEQSYCPSASHRLMASHTICR